MAHGVKASLKTAVLVVLIALACTGILDRGLRKAGLSTLARANDAYLDTAFDKALAGFLILSGIKSGLAIVEGSEVGVGFNLELGDAVQSLYDYVDIAWRAAMAGGAIIVMMQLALDGVAMVDHWVLALVLTVFLAGHLIRWLRPKSVGTINIISAFGRWGLTFCVILYLVLPLAVTMAAHLSGRLTAPLIETSHVQFRELGETLSPEVLNNRFFGDLATSGLATLDIKKKINTMSRGVKELMTFLKTESEQMAGQTLKLIAAYLFDCILFPLFFGIILITLLKSSVGQFFELSRPVQ
jgi:hypothetical protein